MYKALYRLWRPTTFDEVCGQEQVTDVLRAEVISGRISHAYLFCGSRGTGKTTCAKILAKAVNCESPVNGSPCGRCASCLSIENGTATDVYEMDAASNNGVDSIRTLRDEVVYTPSELKYRVYIVDEVHMLSQSAFNALLKTLEEPPEYVIFILATTERHKIPSTILSRCQRFDFNRVTSDVIVSRLKTVCEGENIEAESDAMSLIAEQANGSFRDALNLLEYCAASAAASGDARISGDRARVLLGSTPLSLLKDAAIMIGKKDVAGVLSLIEETDRRRDTAVFMRELTGFFRNMLLASSSVSRIDAGISDEEMLAAEEAAQYYNNVELLTDIDILGDALKSTSLQSRLAAELAVVKMCMPKETVIKSLAEIPTTEALKASQPVRESDNRDFYAKAAIEKDMLQNVTPATDESTFAETEVPTMPDAPPDEPFPADTRIEDLPGKREDPTPQKQDRPSITDKYSAPKNDTGDADWTQIRQELAEDDASIAFFIEGTYLKRTGAGFTVYTDDLITVQILRQEANMAKIAERLKTDVAHINIEYLPEDRPPEPMEEVLKNSMEENI